jgi:hypothetical protein
VRTFRELKIGNANWSFLPAGKNEAILQNFFLPVGSRARILLTIY